MPSHWSSESGPGRTTMVGQVAFGRRDDVVRLIPVPVDRVLDIGCGPGLMGLAIREAGAREVWGVERDPQLAADARTRLSGVVCGDVSESPCLDLPAGSFDVVVYADVLEHLVDPWAVLKAQTKLLKPGGLAVFSLPNIRNARVLISLLLRGRWTYEDEGIMSIGHLRFFTTRTMRRMITGAGYTIVREEATYRPKGRLLWRLSLGLLDDFVAEQRLFVARLTEAEPSLPEQE